VLEALETAAKGIEKTETSGLKSQGRVYLVVMDVTGNVLEDLIGLRTSIVSDDGGVACGASGNEGARGGGREWACLSKGGSKHDDGIVGKSNG